MSSKLLKNKAFKLLIQTVILSIAETILLLLWVKAKGIIFALIFLFTIALHWSAIMRRRKKEAPGAPLLRVSISMIIEIFLLFKTEYLVIHLTAESFGSGKPSILSILTPMYFLVAPMILNICALLTYLTIVDIIRTSQQEIED